MTRPSANGAVIWEDPPGANAQGRWLAILNPLVEQPGVWARVSEAPSPGAAAANASNLKRRILTIPRPDDHWEFVSRTVNGSSYVYGRYIGEKA